jgi:hypothetical protein
MTDVYFQMTRCEQEEHYPDRLRANFKPEGKMIIEHNFSI